ncbi:MAG: methyltransferase [Candidatus Omnitrophota bacterium]
MGFLIILWGVIWEWIIIPAVCIYASTAISKILPLFLPITPFDAFLEVSFISLGLFWTFASCFELTSKGKGTIIPFYNPPRILVKEGVYSYCRNPMYFGYIQLFFGLSIIIHSLTNLLLFLIGIILFFIFYIRLKEERVLEQRFGENYRHYKMTTPLFFPRTFLPQKYRPAKFFLFLHLSFFISVLLFFVTEIIFAF